VPDPREVDVADVWKKDRLAARLLRHEGLVRFEYTPDYLSAPGPPVATTLPLDPEPVVRANGALPAFFSGLLPEGARLTALLRRVKTSASDELSLLLALGGDTVGDVRVLPEGEEPSETPATVRAERWEDTDFVELFAAAVGVDVDDAERAALPGAQVKVSAEVISFPVRHRVGAAILKLSPPDYPLIVENEHFFMRMAAGCGLRVADVEVVHDRNGRSGLLVRRFDRVLVDRSVTRLAQEDGCQLLDLYPADKYRVRFLELCRRVMQVSTVPLPDALALVQAAAFSYAIGNGDLHAKNLSVGETLHGDVRLTPVYDMLSTLAYMPGDQLALAIEGRRDRLRRSHLVAFAARLGVPERATLRMLDHMCEAAAQWVEQLSGIGFDDRITARLEREMRRRIADLRAA